MTIGGMIVSPVGDSNHPDLGTMLYASILSIREGRDVMYMGDPIGHLVYPIFEHFDDQAAENPVVATLLAIIQWSSYFRGTVPPNSKAIIIILETPCQGSHTYRVSFDNVEYQGPGDLHESRYDHLERTVALNSLLDYDKGIYKIGLDEMGCPYTLRVYPTREMEDDNSTYVPLVTTLAVGVVFIFTLCAFIIYDRLVERRQKIVLRQANQSSAIVSNFFPDAVRKRLLPNEAGDGGSKGTTSLISQTSRLKKFLAGDEPGSKGKLNAINDPNLKPIADLFPFCSVAFGDIAGFTAWSSTREPAQVFVLLQTIYQAFDVVAKKYGVFKVETIGDSYVAATGLPNEQPDHAVRICRFANEAIRCMNQLTTQLERTLGPDTSDLAIRFGIHSGPVTAGVLRGDRARFQLFGDTVNTAARMESTGKRNRIQISEATAAELRKQGKEHWLTERHEVVAKVKGIMHTYWLFPRSRRTAKTSSFFVPETAPDASDMNENNKKVSFSDGKDTANVMKQARLVDWCVEVLLDHLRKIVLIREKAAKNKSSVQSFTKLTYHRPPGLTNLAEVQEELELPEYNKEVATLLATDEYRNVYIDPTIVDQLRNFVSVIASSYRANAFHSFEHACHVTMSVDKFLKRIVSPDMQGGADDHKALHEYTHGLTSDPLMLMGIVFSALIHDADHRGVSNAQLGSEEPQLNQMYQGKSIAEQNSLDIAWDLLMQSDYESLRSAMFTNHADLLRFRQVVVNIVLATDIFDKELNGLRKARWERAFLAHPRPETTIGQRHRCDGNDNNLRATIVAEHIIQASDVSHTMQHWHIYRKWNERLFAEMTAAYQAGRLGKNPSDFWFQGELGFFDNYIVPLAKKLKDCNVFGVSSDECLNYAMLNRHEWEQRGQEIVAELTAKYRQGH